MANETATAINQYLTFQLGEEEYGIDVRRIREILEKQSITGVPRTAEHMLGVINVRGSVVPVMDLRIKLGLPVAEQTVETCVVVLEAEREAKTIQIGALVDRVDEVLELTDEDIEPTPSMGTAADSSFLKGVGKREERFIMLLDIDGLFATGDLQAAQNEAEIAETELN